MVLALTHSRDNPVQEQMERHLTGDLKALGYDAISSMKEYGANFFDSLDEKTVISKLHNDQINAILTIVLLNKSMESYDVLWNIFFSPYVIYDNDFWDYYNATHYKYDPRYYQEHTTWYWQSNLYDATSKALLYSVQTQSFDPSSTEKLSHRYGKRIIQNMIKNKVLHTVK